MPEPTNDELIIKLSKGKIIALMAGGVIFVLGSLWLLSIADTQTRSNPMYIKTVSIAGIIFFGIAAVYAGSKLFDNKPGLIINSEGIMDNSSAVGGHLIKWSDIKAIEVKQIKSTKFILVFAHHPDQYYTGVNKFKGFMMKQNEKLYGTPLSISSVSLQCSFDELLKAIESRLEKHKTLLT